MTADQIRNSFSGPHTEQEWMPMHQAMMLQEIAAQLAELNATIAKIADPTVGISVGLCATNDTIPVRILE
jgi:hypothetical protein